VWTFRDRVESKDPEHRMVAALTSIAGRMEEAWAKARQGAAFVGVELVAAAEAALFDGEGASRLERFASVPTEEDRRREAERMAAVCAFLRSAAAGCVFLCAHAPIRFVSYEPGFEPFPGLVLLDATFDLSGMALLGKGMDRLTAPEVHHGRLLLHHLPMPGRFGGSVKKLLEKAPTARPYADWIARAVLGNTQPGELILVVLHKTLVDQERLAWKADPSKPQELDGRRVLTMTWGSGIGSNAARDAEAVFLVNEFYTPRATVIGNVLGGRGQRFDQADDLKDVQAGNLGGIYHDFRKAHLMRWAVQLAARGRMRQVDAEGRCLPMRLYSTMPLERLLEVRKRAFPTAPLPVVLSMDDQEQDQGRGGKSSHDHIIRGLINRLTREPEGAILCSKELEQTIGMAGRNLKRYMAQPKVNAVAHSYGWRLVDRKDVGLSGKGSVLHRAALGALWAGSTTGE
jgi:hypothetical protein